MKKLVLTLCVLAVTATTLRAQTDVGDGFLNPIITAIPSLSIAPDARAGGMGDVGVATRPDIFSQHWNPSKYAFMESPAGFGFSYTPWLSQLVDDINLFYMAGFWQLDDFQTFSASVRYFSLGRILLRRTGDPFEPVMEARPNEFAIDLAYSRRLSETLSASVAFRYIRGDLNVPHEMQDTEMFPAHAFAADISAFYTRPITMASGDGILSFGANISNIGTKVSYDEITSNFLPTNFRLGGSFEMPFDNFNRLSIGVDAVRPLVITRNGRFMQERPDLDFRYVTVLQSIFGSFTDGDFFQRMIWSVGAEYSYNNQFFVRAGYHHEHQMQGGRRFFTAGAGFRLNVFQLDAGYVIATTPANPLDRTLRFSLSFDLDGLRALMN